MVLRQNDSWPQLKRRRAFWTCYGITAVSAAVSAFYALSAVFGGSGGDTFALYAASRSVALVVAVLSVAVWRSNSVLLVLTFTMAAVQGLDALIGLRTQDVAKTAGPAVLATAAIVAAITLARLQPPPAREVATPA